MFTCFTCNVFDMRRGWKGKDHVTGLKIMSDQMLPPQVVTNLSSYSSLYPLSCPPVCWEAVFCIQTDLDEYQIQLSKTEDLYTQVKRLKRKKQQLSKAAITVFIYCLNRRNSNASTQQACLEVVLIVTHQRQHLHVGDKCIC